MMRPSKQTRKEGSYITRKDYVLLASAIERAHTESLGSDMKEGSSLTAERIADALQADNPRFDRARFLNACGVTR